MNEDGAKASRGWGNARRGLCVAVVLAVMSLSALYSLPIQSNGYSYALHIHWVNEIRQYIGMEQLDGSWPADYTGLWRAWDRWGRLREEALLNEGFVHTYSLYDPSSSQLILHRLWTAEFTEYAAMTPEGVFLCKWRCSPTDWTARQEGTVWINPSIVADHGRFYDFVVYSESKPECRIQISWSDGHVSQLLILSTRSHGGTHDLYAFSWPDNGVPEGKRYAIHLDDPAEDAIHLNEAREVKIAEEQQRFVDGLVSRRPPQRQPRDILVLAKEFVAPQLWGQ